MISRHEITFQEKIKLIHNNKERNGLSQCQLAEKYDISLSLVSTILKPRAEFLNDYETNQNQSAKRKIDDQLYE
jgi:transcriptional regulator with XRE-family HTH domain